MYRAVTFASVALLATVTAGCSAASEINEPVETSSDLTFEHRDDQRVSGSYVQQETDIAFEFSKRGETREVTLKTGSGEVLLRDVLSKDGIETMDVLGGRATVTGDPSDENPSVEGDGAAIDELNRRPEMKLVEPLRDALVRAGVATDLVSPPRTAGLQTRADHHTWYVLGCYQSQQFPTWSFWYPTNMIVANQSGKNAWFNFASGPGFYSWEQNVLPPWVSNTFSRQYWGYPVRITNPCTYWQTGHYSVAVYVY